MIGNVYVKNKKEKRPASIPRRDMINNFKNDRLVWSIRIISVFEISWNVTYNIILKPSSLGSIPIPTSSKYSTLLSSPGILRKKEKNSRN